MAKRMLADVLWQAANERLTPPSMWNEGTNNYSCNAVLWVEMPGDYLSCGDLRPLRKRSKTNTFLKQLGCKVNSGAAFRGEFTDSLQGIRYMWLLLAMHVADDEGIEV